ncbi:MAG: hypothetical protein FJZ63_01050 [Chlamydiae bacterium]|nr:hypothetical protein [Chlamydiota bacterium]
MSLTVDNSPFIGYAESMVDSLESCACDLSRDDTITEVAVNRLRESVIFLKQSGSQETTQEAYADIVALFIEDDEESDIRPWYKWDDVCSTHKEEIHLCKSHSHKHKTKNTHSGQNSKLSLRKLKRTAIAIKKYIQKHKKAIMIGAVVVVAVTAAALVIVYSGGVATQAATAGLSAVGGAIAATNESIQPPAHKPNNTSTPSSSSKPQESTEPPIQKSSNETTCQLAPTTNLDNSQPSPSYAENTSLEKSLSPVKPTPDQPPNVSFNPVQAAMAQTKPVAEGPSKPFQSLNSAAMDTKATLQQTPPEPSTQNSSSLLAAAPQNLQTTKSHLEKALNYSAQTQSLPSSHSKPQESAEPFIQKSSNAPTTNLNSSQPSPRYAENTSPIKPTDQSSKASFNPVQAAMAQTKPVAEGPSKPFQSLNSAATDTKATLQQTSAYYPPEPPVLSPNATQNSPSLYEPTPQNLQTAKSYLEKALNYSAQAQSFVAHELFSSVSNLVSIPSAINEITNGALAPLTGAVTLLPQMLNTSWQDIIANGHEKIDEFFSTNQAANYPELSLGDKLIKGSLDLAMCAPNIVFKTAQGAVNAAKTVLGAEKIAYVSEALAPVVNVFKPALAVDAAEGAALKSAASQEVRALKNIESLEGGVVTTTESALAKESTLEKSLAQSNKTPSTDQALLESIEKFKKADEFLKPYYGQFCGAPRKLDTGIRNQT